MVTAELNRSDASLARIVELARTALQASASGFYWLDPALNMVEVSTIGMPQRFSDDYHAGVGAGDPCFARRLVGEHKRLAMLRDERTRVSPAETAPYLALLSDFSFIDSAEMIFWKDGVPFAGLGILKRDDDPGFSQESVTVAAALQHYFEDLLIDHPQVRRAGLAARYGLTLREVEVAGLLADGASNSDIAAILGIGVSTVKTHVRRCFDKLGLKSRAALISFLR